MKNFRLVDNILGWVTFFIAAFVYCSTIEPTASFWDCPEFIATGYKLEIGHPPGAPFFMLTANLFSQFVSDPSQVARMVNTMSALLSAACIMFLFWTITHLVRRLLSSDGRAEGLSPWQVIAIEGSGLVGALIYTFSDTFWYSAVEGEVYAYSSAFTAVVFWLILKWEDHADEPHSDRWLVLITYITGLSIGVHLLNLLCVPAIVLVYYYKRFPNANLKGSICALVVSAAIVAAILYGVVPGIVTVGGWFELLFVNVLGMKFNTGLIIYILLAVAAVVWAISESQRGGSQLRQNVAFLLAVAMLGIPFYGYGTGAAITGIVVLALLALVLWKRVPGLPAITARMKNTATLCMLMLMIGYSTYAVIVVRSSANPPMDQNSPEDIFTLGTYLSRDQYGDRPLLYGQAYSSEVKYEPTGDGQYMKPVTTEGAPVYQRKEKASKDEEDQYFIVRHKFSYSFEQNMFFPRMYDSGHTQDYENWLQGAPDWVNTRRVYASQNDQNATVEIPSQAANWYFFLTYQCNFMYWRYFLWNFAGRQNDLQGHGDVLHGNWISGISLLDDMRLGKQELLPDDLKTNKGHNVFYCLPLLLGLLGLFWQACKGKKGIQQFWVVFFLFFMTGLAIVIYLNQTPQQPRERDYAYAGSFYAFAIWCGMGVAALIDMVATAMKKQKASVAAVIGAAALLVPLQMASQTWDDHDRSGRYTCRDFGQNYLMTLQDEGYPIIFTNGDNDTFPLWYNQDVEGVRTDARVCNLSYLQTDWYIDQMIRPAYKSPKVPITWPRLDYCSGTNEVVEVVPEFEEQILNHYKENPEEAKQFFGERPFELKDVLETFVRGRDRNGKYAYNVIPTDTLYVTIDKEAVRKSGMMMAADSIPDRMVISLKGKRALYKGDLMMLEMIAQCNWTRPIYVATTVGEENYMNLGDNFIQEGLANRISPFTTNNHHQPVEGAKSFDTEKTFYNMVNRYKYGGLEKKGIYLDETVMRMCLTHRHLFGDLVDNLLKEDKREKALKALDFCEKALPAYNIPHNVKSAIGGGSIELAKGYALLGQKEKARKITEEMVKDAFQYIDWCNALPDARAYSYQDEFVRAAYVVRNCIGIADIFDSNYAEKLADRYGKAEQAFYKKLPQEQEDGLFY
ncbi:MAG: DUF2723 domain-containing protein [Prevotella sp.]|nr:DUF2723 domain-containing protein [Prevotella sp.]